MKIYHEHFGLNILDIDAPEYWHVFMELKKQYSRIPNTKCLFCPGCDAVVATCCKNFNPAMNLVEFISILRVIHSQWNDEQRNKLLFQCFITYLNPSLIKRCPLLSEDNRCQIYENRPSGCRYYGQYNKNSWDARMKSVSKRLGIPINQLPMNGEQCNNIEIEGKKYEGLSHVVEDDSFEKIFHLDKELFSDKMLANHLVMQGLTYMPFDAHYLLYRTGADNLELLTDMRTNLDFKRIEFKNKKDKNLSDKELEEEEKKLKEEEKKVEDFLNEVKKNIFIEKVEKKFDGEKDAN